MSTVSSLLMNDIVDIEGGDLLNSPLQKIYKSETVSTESQLIVMLTSYAHTTMTSKVNAMSKLGIGSAPQPASNVVQLRETG